MARMIRFSMAGLALLGASAGAQDSEYNKAVLDDGPLFYWTFDEPGDQDEAVNIIQPDGAADRLQAQGSATRITHDGDQAILGRMADFDGLNGTRFYAADVGDSAVNPNQEPGIDVLPTGLWIMEMWIQATSDPDRGQYILEAIQDHPNFQNPTNDPAVILDYNTPNYIEIFGGGGRTATGGPQIADNEWHHLVIACYGNGFSGAADRRDLILDGVPYTFRAEVPQSFSFALGRLGLGATALDATGGFPGNVDELAVYDVGDRLVGGGFDITIPNIEAETAMEEIVLAIVAHRDAAAAEGYSEAVLADEPFLYWSFDEAGDKDPAANLASNAVPEDSLAAEGNATRVDHSVLGSGLLLGRAAAFDGAAGTRFFAADLKGSIPGPGIDFVPSQLWALEMWIKAKPPAGDVRADYLLESIYSGANDPGIIYDFITDLSGGTDYLEIFRGERTGTSGPQMSDEEWHHAVFAFYGNSGGFGVANRRDIVLDGRFYPERESAFSSGFGLRELALGNTVAQGGVNGFEGSIDEVALYDVGSKLAAAGIDVSVQSAAGEAAFESFLKEIAAHRLIVPGACEEEPDAVTIEGPDTGTIGSPVTLTAAFTGADAGAFSVYAWSVTPADAILVVNGDGTATVDAARPGTVTVKVEADDGVCEGPGTAVKSSRSICFETADAVTIGGPSEAEPSQVVTLEAIFAGADPVSYIDRASAFSSGFALVEYAVGNTVADGGVNGIEGRIDEMAVYDVGTWIANQGIDISVPNAEAEAAFEGFVGELAGHVLDARSEGYPDEILSHEPVLYWSFDEGGDIDPAVNLASPDAVEDQLIPGGTATRVDHESIESELRLGRTAQFDGSNGCRFYAADLKGPEFAPGTGYIASQLWAIEFWFQVAGANDGYRSDYFVEGFAPGAPNNPGLIHDFDFAGPDRIEMFGGGGRTGDAGPVVPVDGKWHHIIMAFYGNSGGFGIANRREIIVDGGFRTSYAWSVVSGDATISDLGGGSADVTVKSPGTVVVRVEAGDVVCGDGASAEHTITVKGVTGGGQVPGDLTQDSKLDLSDPIALLGHLFLGQLPVLPCEGGKSTDPGNAALLDGNGDTKVDLSDAIYTLQFLFLGGPPPVLGKACVAIPGCPALCTP